MTTTEARAGNPMAPPLPELSAAAEVALLARMLHREGYDDHLAGHITYRQPDDTLLVTPFGLMWDEVRASDIMRIDMDGAVLEGPWTMTPAITLHVELHRARPDVAVAVHNHPRWGTIWADLQRVPPVYDQSSAMVAGDVALYNEYGGTIGGPLWMPRSFFFVNAEGIDGREADTRLAHVPTPAERAGDFSASGMTIRDPSTGTEPNSGCSTIT